MDVGALTAATTGPVAGADYLLWQYVVVIKPGPTTVRCTIGDVTVVKEVDPKPAQVAIVNFCFGEPVVVSPGKRLQKLKIPVRRSERLREREYAGERKQSSGS